MDIQLPAIALPSPWFSFEQESLTGAWTLPKGSAQLNEGAGTSDTKERVWLVGVATARREPRDVRLKRDGEINLEAAPYWRDII